jgi:hypothetical protein
VNILIIKTFFNSNNNIVIYQKTHYNTIDWKDSCVYRVECVEGVLLDMLPNPSLRVWLSIFSFDALS